VTRHWRDRLLASTRGRVLSELRRGPRTVNELADLLGLTDNAVRLHLAGLERDGLIAHEGVRRGIGKPAHVFVLTPEADSLFPKAYATILTALIEELRAREGNAQLEEMMRAIGKRIGALVRSDAPDLRTRVDAAARVLTDLGGLVDVIEGETDMMIRGYSCPLAAVVQESPETCALAEELVSGVTGEATRECCDRSGEIPRCAFRVSA
jgi:predicted ArsR family transcriptional regulator